MWRKRVTATISLMVLLSTLVAGSPAGAQALAEVDSLTVNGPGTAEVGRTIEISVEAPSSAAAVEAALSFDPEALEFGGVYFENSVETLAVTADGAAHVGAFRCAASLCESGLVAPIGEMRVRFMVLSAGNHQVLVSRGLSVDADGNVAAANDSETIVINAGNGAETAGSSIGELSTSRAPVAEGVADVNKDRLANGADIFDLAAEWDRTRRTESGACELDERATGFDVDQSGCLDIADLAAVGTAIDAGVLRERIEGQLENDAQVAANADNAPLVVDSTGDAADSNVNDGTCRTSSGVCTLRAAIQQANSNAGSDAIHFNIAGSGPHNINLGSPLPGLYDTSGGVTIDGYTQPGSQVNTSETIFNGTLKIQVSGRGQSARQVGLPIYGPGNTVRGLAIYNSYTNLMISGNGARQNTIVGNIIGSNAATTWSTSSSVQDQAGIEMRSGGSYNQIGTIALEDRNVISGNSYSGVRVNHSETVGNRIQNNMVGFNASATGSLYSYVAGVDVQWGAQETWIGGYQKFAGNAFAKNQNYGVDLSHSSKNNLVVGNRIGTDPTGTRTFNFTGSLVNLAIKDNTVGNTIEHNVIGGGTKTAIWHRHNFTGPNTFRYNWVGVGLDGSNIRNPGYGMELSGHDDTYVGNIFANSGSTGVSITSFNGGNGFSPPQYTQSNRLSDNSFFSNGGAAISISGAHNNVAAPRINAASQGSASGTACSNCTVELYVSHQGEGRQFITSTEANGSGAWSISDDAINNVSIQALVINANSDTSVFSSARQVGSSGGNTAPTFAPIADQSSPIGQWFRIAPTVTDPDGDYLTYHAIGLPQGVTIDRRTGEITGRPPEAGTYHVRVAVDDGNSFQVRPFHWIVGAELSVDPIADRFNIVNVPVSEQVVTTGGQGTLQFSANGLPPGLNIDQASGLITGTPTALNTHAVTVTVTDGVDTDSASFQWQITTAPPLVITAVETQTGRINAAASLQLAATGGSGDYTYAATGLPVGLSVNPSTGLISGSPTTGGVFNVNVSVTDQANDADSTGFQWTVSSQQPAITSRTGFSTSSGGYFLGWRFTVDEEVRVTDLGIFDANQDGVLSNPSTTAAGLYNYNSRQLLASVNIPSGAAAEDGFIYQALDQPITLSPGINYVVAAGVQSGGEPYSHRGSASFADPVNYVGQAYKVGAALGFPSSSSPGAEPSWIGATFRLEAAQSVTLGAVDDQQSSVGEAGSLQLQASGGSGNYTYAATGLPGGVSVDPVTGLISGTPTADGLFEVFVSVTDDTNASFTTSFRWTVGSADIAVRGRVTDLAGAGVADVAVDLFSEGRAVWLRATTTGSDGRYEFDVDPGCYVVTFIAPDNAEFGSGQYASAPTCVGNGQGEESVDAQLLINGGNDSPRIEATVNNRAGSGVSGVKVDLFQSDENAARIAYLRTTTTDQAGNYSFTLSGPACVILTFVAPEGETFVESGSTWLNRYTCLSAGQVETDITATVDVGGNQAEQAAGGVITSGGNPLSGVQVDLYKANGDGSRGAFEQLTSTGADGMFSFDIAEPGCFILTYIAPEGETWTNTGTRWWNRSFCITSGETITDLNATLG